MRRGERGAGGGVAAWEAHLSQPASQADPYAFQVGAGGCMKHL